MTGNEYLQFMTKKFSHFITIPIEKNENEQIHPLRKRSFDKNDWFGNAPFYFWSLMQKRK